MIFDNLNPGLVLSNTIVVYTNTASYDCTVIRLEQCSSVWLSSLKARDEFLGQESFISQVEFLMLGLCLSPIIIPILYVLLKLTFIQLRNPVAWFQRSSRNGAIKFLTFPVAYFYFRVRFGGRFFRKESFCFKCQLEPVNSVCPGCGWYMAQSPWGRYMGGSRHVHVRIRCL